MPDYDDHDDYDREFELVGALIMGVAALLVVAVLWWAVGR